VPAEAGAAQRGFRPERRIAAPSEPYDIQQHEVTWGELDPWLAGHLEVLPAAPAAWREPLCATGVCLEKSRAHLQSVGFRCARGVP
jgi:hypothetical protein